MGPCSEDVAVSLEGYRVDSHLCAFLFDLPRQGRRRQKCVVNVEKKLTVIIFFPHCSWPSHCWCVAFGVAYCSQRE